MESLSARRAWIEIKAFWIPCGNAGMSLSARRAWIEILRQLQSALCRRSLSARRAWIEITVVGVLATLVTSLSARRAWIEIWWLRCWQLAAQDVALRKESVDRNETLIVLAK